MTKAVLWYGELTTRPKLYRRGVLVIAAAALWLLAFLVLPSLVLIAVSFATRGLYGTIDWTPTLENYNRLAGFGVFGWSANILFIAGRSIWMALVTTVFALLLAYPVAFFIAGRSARLRYVMLALVMVPFCTNMVIRVYAWKLLLDKDLPLAKLAAFMGMIPEGISLHPSTLAVYLGMVSSFLPFAILPLYTNVERIDWSIVEAAQDLYATRWSTFRNAILPQTTPGLVAAIILTFIPAMGTFVIPDLLGGSNYMLIGNLIQQQFGPSRDLPFGAAISFATMALTLLALFLIRKRIPDPEVLAA